MARLQGNSVPVDPNVPLPPAVRAQAQRIDDMIRSQSEAPQPEPAPAPPADPPPAPAAVAPEPPPPPAPAIDPPPAPAPSPAPSAPEGDDPNSDTWAQRFRSELGRNRRMQNQLAEMSNRVTDLERLLATVSAPAAPAPSEMQFEKLLTAEEEAEWGEALPVIEKKARELIQPLEAQLNAKIKLLDERLGKVGEATVQDARSRMLERLDTHPVLGTQGDNSWRELNRNDEFVEWLLQIDRRSGRTLQSLLEDAFNSNDAARTAAFFEDFLKEVAPATAPQPAPSPAPPNSGKVTLETFAAPGRAQRSAAPPAGPADKPIFTTGDVSKFYADVSAGRYKGRDDERQRQEADIIAAGREGRVKAGKPQQL